MLPEVAFLLLVWTVVLLIVVHLCTHWGWVQLDHRRLEGSDLVAVPGEPGWHSSHATSTSRSDSYSLHHLLDTNPPPKYRWVMPILLKGFFLRWGMWRVVVVVDFYHIPRAKLNRPSSAGCLLSSFLPPWRDKEHSLFFLLCLHWPSKCSCLWLWI